MKPAPAPAPAKDIYVIVEERDKSKFEKEVNALLSEGWVPESPLIIIGLLSVQRYIQSFIRRHEKAGVVGLKVTFGLATLKARKQNMPQEASITNEQKIPASVTPLSEAGKPAKLDGALAWSVISGTGTVANVSADGLTAELVSGDDPGDTTYLIKGDADLGSGVVEVSDTIVLHVLGAMAAHLGIEFGAAVPK